MLKIYSQEELFLNGHEVDAINSPGTQEIQISRSHWKALDKMPKQKYVLVLHEFLGLMGQDDRTFAISNKIFDDPHIQVSQISCPAIRMSPALGVYSLAIVKFEAFQAVAQEFEYRGVVYKNGIPDENSEVIVAPRARLIFKDGAYVQESGLVGSAIVQKDNPQTGPSLFQFVLWPGTPFKGESTSESYEPVDRFQFDCSGDFSKIEI